MGGQRVEVEMDRSFGRCRDLRVQSRNAQAPESLHNSPFGALVQFVQQIAGRAVGHKLLCTGHSRQQPSADL